MKYSFSILIFMISFTSVFSGYSQIKKDGILIKTSFPEDPIVSIKNDKKTSYQNPFKKYLSEDNIIKNNSLSNGIRDSYVIPKNQWDSNITHTFIASGNEQYLASCVVTEQNGSTAGKIWAVAIIRSNLPGNDKIGIYNFEQNDWVLKTYFYTFRYLGASVDAEIIEPSNGNKFLWIITESQQSLFSKREVLLSSINLQNLTAFSANLSWPGAGSQDEYYNPKITTDNGVDNSTPWLYIVASVDSITPDNKHFNAQKFAFVDNAFNSVNPHINYRSDILPVFWPVGGTNEIHTLYSDIAFLNYNNQYRLIFTYSNVPDDTRIWLSSCDNLGTNASFIGTIDGSGNYKIGKSAIASAGGLNQEQLMVVFEENNNNSGDWDLISAKSNDGAKTWLLSAIVNKSSTIDFIPHIGTLVSRRGVLNDYYLSYAINNPADSILSVHSNNSFSIWDKPIKMSFASSDYIQSSVGFTNITDERVTVWSNKPSSNQYQLNATFYPDLPTDVRNESNNVPKLFELYQNHPNPFNPTTKINYRISKPAYVQLKVIDLLGKEAATLVNEEKTAGNYEVLFNAVNLSSGVYFYSIQANEYFATRKMILLR